MIQDMYNLNKYIASSDGGRYHLNGVQVDPHATDSDKRLLVATDGHVAAVIEVESKLDVGFYHSDIIETSFKMHKLSQDYSALLKPTAGVKFCNWKAFIVDYDKTLKRELDKDETTVDNYNVITLNPDLLYYIKKGLGIHKSKGLQLIIKHKTAPVRVNCQMTDRYAVVMPMRAF